MAVRVRVGLIIPLYVMWIIHLTTGQKANITIPPRAVNVSINAVAEFTCTAVASNIIWRANGQQIDKGERAELKEVVVNEILNIRMSTLNLTASSTDNATNITCFAGSFSPSVTTAESYPALLLVQGSLVAVNDLAVVSFNSTTVLIFWSPPFTLEGVPILGYNVAITNTTSEENETISVEGDTTMLYYSIDHPDPDNNFTVTVVPINIVGPGDNVTTSFSFNFVDVSTSVLSSTLASLFQTTSTLQDNSTLMISTETVSTHVKPTPSESSTNNDAVPLGPGIIGGIVGGIIGGGILIVLLLVLTLCALLLCVRIIRKQKDSKLTNITSKSSTCELLSARNDKGENPCEIPCVESEEKGPSNEPSSKKNFLIQASVTTQPKELHYAELGAFRVPKKRPKSAPQTDSVLYATVSSVSHERMHAAKMHGVPSDEDIAMISWLVAHKWRLVGQELGVDPAELDQIASENVYTYLCSSELFRKWSAGEITASCPFTLKAVIETLYSESVGESSLAKKLLSTHL